jgi:hypothetical protein
MILRLWYLAAQASLAIELTVARLRRQVTP